MSFPSAPKSAIPLALSSDELLERERKQQIYLIARNRAFDILYIDIVRRFTDTKKTIIPHNELGSVLRQKWSDNRVECENQSHDSRKRMQISTTATWERRINDDLLSQEGDIERPVYFCKKDQIEKNIIFTPTSIITRHRSEFREYVSENGYIPAEIVFLIFDLKNKENNQRVDYGFRFILTLSHDHSNCPSWD